MSKGDFDAPLLCAERVPDIPQGFEVRQRPYKTDAPTGYVLKHTWELAPSGAVFYLKPVAIRESSSLSASFSRTAAGSWEEDANGDDFYVPGVKQSALGQLRATAIAGNDITSSCLYATGIVATSGGRFAPISSSLVCLVLYFYRYIYAEVFSAIPMNGGTYNALLNTVDKNFASLAAILSTLSYTATAVTSASSAGDYLNSQWSAVPPKWICIGVLCAFALLTLLGIRESANAATALFLLHVSTLLALLVSSLVFVIQDGGRVLNASWNSSSTAVNPYNNWAANIFYGYSSALLGVTGFESSSNYIEEQRPGVFPLTLRNMWLVVTIVNPALSVLAMGVVPIEELVHNANFSLAMVAEKAVGEWFKIFVIVDAALVLAGAVLTAFVGVEGLHRRLALDRIMPPFFLKVNRCFGSNHFIIIGFCLLTCSLRLLVDDMQTLGGVYAISFLSVMMFLCASNLLMKYKRGRLPRSPIAHPIIVILAFILVAAGLIGNILRNVRNVLYFAIYFVVFAFVVIATRLRVALCRLLCSLIPQSQRKVRERLQSMIASMRHHPVVYFAKQPALSVLNKVVQYIIDNEDTHTVKIIHMVGKHDGLTASRSPEQESRVTSLHVSEESERLVEGGNRDEESMSFQEDVSIQVTMKQMEACCAIVDQLYPKLTIELLFVYAPFTPHAVYEVSKELDIPRNLMFMGCPGDRFPHNLGHFGGVRVITY